MPLPLDKLLNPQQLEAATWPEGPVCIVAGAGSGKTRVITHRLAHLVETGRARPEECLAVTFTNKAARELRDRVDVLLPGTAYRMWVSTFHSAAARILREAHGYLGLPRGFVIYDQDDSVRLIKQICGELNIAKDLISTYAHRIEQLKHQAIPPEKFEPDPFDIPGKRVREVYTAYEARLARAGAVDFGGLIVLALKVARENPEASYSLGRIRHAVVDEYQDVNRAQAALVETLAPRLGSLAVVGDDDQSIYRWRGASAYSLLQFTETFPATHQVRLEENYRSTGRILKLANEIIRQNPGRLTKELWTRADDGPMIRLRQLRDDRSEAAWAVDDSLEAIRTGTRPSELAFLYRTNAQSRPLEEALHRARIRYRILGGLRFYERREVKDVVSYLRLVANPDSEMDLRRIINVPARAIGDTTLSQLAAAAQAAKVSLWGALALPEEALAAAGMKAAGRTKLREFGTMLGELRAACAGRAPAVAITEVIARTAYDQHLRLEEDGQERLDNLASLARAANDYEEDARRANEPATLEAFLERVSLESGDENEGADSAESVTLMTLHSAKGLEFDAVYVMGVEEDVLPSARAVSSEDAEALNEERRLAYVGFTRARRRLTLSMCQQRLVFGEIRYGTPSRFLRELPPSFVREHLVGDLHAILPRAALASAMPRFDRAPRPEPRSVDRGETRVVYDDAPTAPRRPRATTAVLDLDVDERDMVAPRGGGFAPGSGVLHAQYGRGTVEGVTGTGDNARVDVFFPEHGQKRIVAKYLRRA
ncbi:MAG: UvrD-helicase domain-containing protein [Deltaproteobacteria bacterium]|nr:UvrD-helicase domain-containing protein [Deltaproteobacteria bacterium]